MIDFNDYKILSDYDANHVFMGECRIFYVLKIKKLFVEKIFSKKMMINGQMRLKQKIFRSLTTVKDHRNQGGRSLQRLKTKKFLKQKNV